MSPLHSRSSPAGSPPNSPERQHLHSASADLSVVWQSELDELAGYGRELVGAILSQGVDIPPRLRVLAHEGIGCTGLYELVQDVAFNGFPLWRHRTADMFLFSGHGHRWFFGTLQTLDAVDVRLEAQGGVAASVESHSCRMPHAMRRRRADRHSSAWVCFDGRRWLDEPSFSVRAELEYRIPEPIVRADGACPERDYVAGHVTVVAERIPRQIGDAAGRCGPTSPGQGRPQGAGRVGGYGTQSARGGLFGASPLRERDPMVAQGAQRGEAGAGAPGGDVVDRRHLRELGAKLRSAGAATGASLVASTGAGGKGKNVNLFA